MKKSIIAAGAASIALAAMPVVSTFAVAAPDIVDKLSIKLDSTCTMTRTGADGANGTWTAGDPETTAAGTYTVASMAAGTMANIGTSTFTIACNDTTEGHSLAVRATGLQGDDTATSYIDYGNNLVQAGTSSWNITLSDVQGFGAGEGNAPVADIVNIASYSGHAGSATLYGATTRSKNAVANATFKATYKVGTTVDQPAATYTGSATYTLTYGANS